MGLTTSSLHVFSSKQMECKDASFVSYSEGWQTCTDDLPDEPRKLAKKISKSTSATVLLFFEYDSEAIELIFYVNGKSKAFFTDTNTDLNTGIYTIPTLIGYEEGEKRRLSLILRCDDTDQKIALLEEYFGVCLTPKETLMHNPKDLNVVRVNQSYKEYYKIQKQVINTLEPIKAELISEQRGKLFIDFFDVNPKLLRPRNPNYYLIGYELEQGGDQLRCVSFQDGEFISIPVEEFLRDLVQIHVKERSFTTNYGFVSRVDFTNDAPEGFRGQCMNLPSGFYPYRFDYKDRLILVGTSSIAFVDNSLRIISRINLKGQITSIQDHYVITSTFGSFFYYGYEAGARIRIYRLIEKDTNC